VKIVRYTPQERVDLPDITAMSFLCLGEFRRTVRYLIQGPSATAPPNPFATVVQGFAVTPATVPDATVTVTLDPGGGAPVGVALSGENLGAVTDFGALIGGRDAAGELEGQALQVLNFAGQPVGAYTVELRQVPYDDATGENDNRAFWNPASNTEFVAAVDTRFLPQWEARFTLAPVAGDEWIPLAVVAWDGAGPITTTEITDIRIFPFEGSADIVGAEGFAPVDQDTFAGPVDGFIDRTASREDPTVGAHAVYPALRLAMRQIRDMKGKTRPSSGVAADSGKWDIYSRPFAPIDYAGSGLPQGAQHTKSLHSVDTVTYTCGDGVVTFGDFNGATALEEALDALLGSTNPTGRPRKASIILKADDRSATTFTVGNAYDFTADGDLDLTIIATGANGAGANLRADISFSFDNSTAGVIQARKLTLRNLDALIIPVRATLFSCEECDIVNCDLQNQFSSDNTQGAYYALRVSRTAGSTGVGECRIERSKINGLLQITDTDTAPSDAHNRFRTGLVRDCEFVFGGILLNAFEETNPSTRYCRTGLVIDGCKFTAVPAYNPTRLKGIIDGRSAQNITVRECLFEMGTRERDGIHIGDGALLDAPPRSWLIEGCSFNVADVRTSAVDGGTNTTAGTGWCVFLQQPVATAPGDFDEQASNFLIRGNYFEGPGQGTLVDAGAIYLEGIRNFSVLDNVFWNFGGDTGSRLDVIHVRNTNGTGENTAGWLCRNDISKFANGSATSDFTGIKVERCSFLRILDNEIVGGSSTRATLTYDPLTSSGISVLSSEHVKIHGNQVEAWNLAAATALGGIVIEPTAGLGCRWISIQNNGFKDNGGYAVDLGVGGSAQEHIVASNNLIEIDQAQGQGINAASSNNLCVNNNMILMTASAGPDGITWGTTAVGGMCMGNRVQGGLISSGGGSVVFGVIAVGTIPSNYVN